MATKLITSPLEEPISTSTAKAHLRVTHAADDLYIQDLIFNATRHAENFMSRKLMTQTHALYLSAISKEIQLPFGEIQSIQGVTYKDAGGVTQTLDPSKYDLNEIGVLTLKEQAVSKDVKITFICGYASSFDVPAPIKQAILMLVTTMYEARGDVEYDSNPKKNVFCSDNLLQPYKIY